MVDSAEGLRPIITAMTGVRALAATAVLVYHVRAIMVALLPVTAAANPWTVYGFVGVDVFFILSGFIISYNYAERFARFDLRKYRSYLRARLARIYPAHLVTLLLTAVLVGGFALWGVALDPTRRHTLGDFVGNLLMLQALPGVKAWNAPSWSVSCELAAYLVFPLCAGVLLRLRRSVAGLLAVAVVVLLVGAVRWIILMPDFSPVLFFWVRIVGEFTLGCLLWVVWRHGTRALHAWDAVGIASLAAVFLTVRVEASSWKTWWIIGFLGLFVLATASCRGVLRRFLASRPLEYGGRISYSVYLIHFPLIAVFSAVVPVAELAAAPLPTRIAIVTGLLATPFLAGAGLHRFVEEPAREWLRGRQTQGQHDPAVGALG